jgi:hypothetical protein
MIGNWSQKVGEQVVRAVATAGLKDIAGMRRQTTWDTATGIELLESEEDDGPRPSLGANTRRQRQHPQPNDREIQRHSRGAYSRTPGMQTRSRHCGDKIKDLKFALEDLMAPAGRTATSFVL